MVERSLRERAVRRANRWWKATALVLTGVLLLSGAMAASHVGDKGVAARSTATTGPRSLSTSGSGPIDRTYRYADAGTATTAVQEMCVEALRLVNEGSASKALALITAFRREATARLKSSPGNPQLLAEATSCPQERALALRTDDAPADGLAAVGEAWTTFTDNVITPLGGPALWGVGTLVVLVLAGYGGARLGSPLIRRPGRDAGRWMISGVVAGLVVCSMASASLSVTSSRLTPSFFWWLLIALIALGALCVICLAVLLGGRMRLFIEVSDSSGKVSPVGGSALAGLLNAFGATRAGRLDVAFTASAFKVEDVVIADVKPTTIIVTLVTALRVALVGSPWTVRVSELSDTQAQVDLRRNGRGVSTTLIDLKTWRVPEIGLPAAGGTQPVRTDRILSVASAAVVMSELTGVHYQVDGLFGATRWRSLALYFLAVTDLSGETDDPTAVALLARALNDDADNDLARIALQTRRYGRQVHPAPLAAYALWLEGELDHGPAAAKHHALTARKLRLRLLMAHATTGRNLRASVAPGEAGQYTHRLQLCRVAAREAMELLRDENLGDRRLRMLAAVTASVLGVDTSHSPEKDWLHEAEASLAPTVAYSVLCRQALANPKTVDQSKAGVAFELSELRTWAPIDPELTALQQKSWFSSAIAPDGKQVPSVAPATAMA